MDGAKILRESLQELADYIKDELHRRIEQYGVNPRTGSNTLSDSDLVRSIQVSLTTNGVMLSINDYWEYVSLGWHHTHRFPNTFNKFVENIIAWIRKKGIRFGNMTENQIAWMVIHKIWNHGIAARPFMVYDKEGDLTKMIPSLDGFIDTWFDDLFNIIMEETDNYFNS